MWCEWWDAGALGVGVVDVAAESIAANHDDEAIFLDVADEDFDAGDCDGVEFFAEFFGDIGGYASGAAVADVAGCVNGDEVAADCNIAVGEGEVDSEGFEDAAADVVFEGVVAEESEVAGAAAGGDAWQNRNAHAQHTALGERIEVGRVGGFKFGFAAWLKRESAESVCDVEDDFGVSGFLETAGEGVDIGHGGELGVGSWELGVEMNHRGHRGPQRSGEVGVLVVGSW